MKRSEVITKLGSKIYLELGPNIRDYDTAKKLADILLSMTEEMGMLPPVTTLDKLQIKDNSWDPESSQSETK